MHSRPRSSWLVPLLLVLLPISLPAQTVSAHPDQYWLTAGAGIGYLATSQTRLGETGSATSIAATLQHHALVTSVRWSRAAIGSRSGWAIGALAGVGSPARYSVRGSVAAGLGVAGGSVDRASLTFPVGVQLGWRLAPALGLGAALFGNFGGPTETLGLTFGLQLGQLR
jgi:hypothetical protein